MSKYIVASLDINISSMAKYEISYYIARAKANNQTTLPILIDSCGGDVYAMRSIMDMLTASGLKIATIANGKVMSAAVPIYMMADKLNRYSFPSATFMIHEAKKFSGMEMMAKTSDLKSSGKEADRLTNDMYNLLDKQAQQTKGYFQKLVYDQGNSDLFLSADEALLHGVVGQIKVPSFVDIFGAADTLPQIKGEIGNDMEEMIMQLAMESSQPLREKRKEFESLLNDKDSEILNQKISAFFNENVNDIDNKNNIDIYSNEKEEFIETMSKPNLDGNNTPDNAGVDMIARTDVMAMIETEAKKREDALTATFTAKMNQVKADAYKEAEMKLSGSYKSEIETLRTEMNEIKVNATVDRAEKEKMKVEKKLYDLKESCVLSQTEVESELTWIMTNLSEGNQRDSYLEKLSSRQPNPAFKKSASLPDQASYELTADERAIIEKFPNKAQEVMAFAKIRNDIVNVRKEKLTAENISKAYKEMANK